MSSRHSRHDHRNYRNKWRSFGTYGDEFAQASQEDDQKILEKDSDDSDSERFTIDEESTLKDATASDEKTDMSTAEENVDDGEPNVELEGDVEEEEGDEEDDEDEDEDESESDDDEEDGDADGDEQQDGDWDTDEDEEEEVDDDAEEDVASSSDDGDDVENCPICLNKFRGQEIASPESCFHTFCLECIMEWSKNVNTCPVDREVFRLIFSKHPSTGAIIKKIRVEETNLKLDEDDTEEVTICEVCNRGDREDRLLLCDGCDLGYHCECLTPALDEVPVEEWFCPDCAGSNIGVAAEVPIDPTEVDDLHDDDDEPIQRPRRLIARTQISERVRAVIAEARIQRNRRVIRSDTEEEEQETPTPATPAKRKSPVKRRKKTPRKKKAKKTTKRKVKGKKKAPKKGKTKKRKGRKGKRKAKKVVKPKPVTTPKSRIADRLGLYKPPTGMIMPLQKSSGEKSSDRSKLDAGIAQLSILGGRDELLSFSDKEESSKSKASQKYSRSALKSHRRMPKPKLSSLSTDLATRNKSPGSSDILGSIMQSQQSLTLGSRDVVINRDGSLSQSEKKPPVTKKPDTFDMFDDSNDGVDEVITEEIESIEGDMEDIEGDVEDVEGDVDDVEGDEELYNPEDATQSQEGDDEERVQEDEDIDGVEMDPAIFGSPQPSQILDDGDYNTDMYDPEEGAHSPVAMEEDDAELLYDPEQVEAQSPGENEDNAEELYDPDAQSPIAQDEDNAELYDPEEAHTQSPVENAEENEELYDPEAVNSPVENADENEERYDPEEVTSPVENADENEEFVDHENVQSPVEQDGENQEFYDPDEAVQSPAEEDIDGDVYNPDVQSPVEEDVEKEQEDVEMNDAEEEIESPDEAEENPDELNVASIPLPDQLVTEDILSMDEDEEEDKVDEDNLETTEKTKNHGDFSGNITDSDEEHIADKEPVVIIENEEEEHNSEEEGQLKDDEDDDVDIHGDLFAKIDLLSKDKIYSHDDTVEKVRESRWCNANEKVKDRRKEKKRPDKNMETDDRHEKRRDSSRHEHSRDKHSRDEHGSREDQQTDRDRSRHDSSRDHQEDRHDRQKSRDRTESSRDKHGVDSSERREEESSRDRHKDDRRKSAGHNEREEDEGHKKSKRDKKKRGKDDSREKPDQHEKDKGDEHRKSNQDNPDEFDAHMYVRKDPRSDQFVYRGDEPREEVEERHRGEVIEQPREAVPPREQGSNLFKDCMEHRRIREERNDHAVREERNDHAVGEETTRFDRMSPGRRSWERRREADENERLAHDREARDREARDREAGEREARDREARDREARERDARMFGPRVPISPPRIIHRSPRRTQDTRVVILTNEPLVQYGVDEADERANRRRVRKKKKVPTATLR